MYLLEDLSLRRQVKMVKNILKISMVVFVLCCVDISLASIDSENPYESLDVRETQVQSLCFDPPPAPEPPTGEVQVGYVGCEYKFWTTVSGDGPYQVRFCWDVYNRIGGPDMYSDWIDPHETDPLNFSASHTWYHGLSEGIGLYVSAQARNYITNDESNWSRRATRIYIRPNDPPNTPEKPSGNIEGSVGEYLTYTTFTTDPEKDNISYLFDWGDNSDSGWSESYPSEEPISVSHKWNSQGNYEVKVKAREADKCNRESEWSPVLDVTIIGGPPSQPILTGPTRGETGTTYTYTATSTDPDGDDIIYCFDWGDGTSEFCTNPLPSGETASVTHTWTTDGDYIITCKASDPSGQESTPAILRVTMPKIKVTHPLINIFWKFIQLINFDVVKEDGYTVYDAVYRHP